MTDAEQPKYRMPLADIREWDRNPRSITKKGFERLIYQVIKLGQYKPMLLRGDTNVALGGNQRRRVYAHLSGLPLDKLRNLMKKIRGDEVSLAQAQTLKHEVENPWVSVVYPKNEDNALEYALSDNDPAGFTDEDMLANMLPEYHLDAPDMFGVLFDKALTLDDLVPKNGEGEATGQNSGSLIDQFLVPPFSVLDAKQEYWQKRKDEWRERMGDTDTTREEVLENLGTIDKDRYAKGMPTVSLFDPVLAELIVRWFNLPGGKTFDPFAGGVFGYVSAALGYPFTGIELRKEQVEANTKLVEGLPATYICDDGINISNHIKADTQDLLFSCPPYYDLEVYSDLPNDASNQKSYEDYLEVIGKALAASYDILKNNRFAVIVVSDIRDKKTGAYRGLPGDIYRIMTALGFVLYNDAVLINEGGTAPIRAKRFFSQARKLIKLHQNVLVFYKGNPKEIKTVFPKVEIPDDSGTTDDIPEELPSV